MLPINSNTAGEAKEAEVAGGAGGIAWTIPELAFQSDRGEGLPDLAVARSRFPAEAELQFPDRNQIVGPCILGRNEWCREVEVLTDGGQVHLVPAGPAIHDN